jgi:hypothetical protein
VSTFKKNLEAMVKKESKKENKKENKKRKRRIAQKKTITMKWL